jgi:hypothetical protein
MRKGGRQEEEGGAGVAKALVRVADGRFFLGRDSKVPSP